MGSQQIPKDRVVAARGKRVISSIVRLRTSLMDGSRLRTSLMDGRPSLEAPRLDRMTPWIATPLPRLPCEEGLQLPALLAVTRLLGLCPGIIIVKARDGTNNAGRLAFRSPGAYYGRRRWLYDSSAADRHMICDYRQSKTEHSRATS